MDWGNELTQWRNALPAWRRPWTLRKLALIAAAAAVVGLAVFWIVTIPASVPASALGPYKPNVENGKTMFDAGDCASCHASPEGDRDKVDRTRLPGGLALTTPFGTLYTPNISPHPTDGIGNWTEANFVTALWDGTSPRGTHYYPALPYTSYQRMKLEDVRDLFAYVKTLPPVAGKARAHAMMFPFSIRRTLGGWKFLFLDGKRFEPDPSKSAEWKRGAYLVNGPGHCAECHSPRNFMMAIMSSQRFAGGPNPEPDRTGCPTSPRRASPMAPMTASRGPKPTSKRCSPTARRRMATTSAHRWPMSCATPGSSASRTTRDGDLHPVAAAGRRPAAPGEEKEVAARSAIAARARRMNTGKGIALKLIAAVFFAFMSSIVRWLGARYPLGELVFFRSAFAILPVVVVYAWRGELASAVRTERPLGQAGRGALSIVGMFCNFGALARLPLVEANAISFTSPLISVALAALILKERVRIYRWSAVNRLHRRTGGIGAASERRGIVRNHCHHSERRRCGLRRRGFILQGRYHDSDAPADAEREDGVYRVLFFVDLCAGRSGHIAVRLADADVGELAALIAAGLLGGIAHILVTESYRYASASVVAPFDYTSMIWALVLGYFFFDEIPTATIFTGSAIIVAAGLFVIWRERQLGLRPQRPRARRPGRDATRRRQTSWALTNSAVYWTVGGTRCQPRVLRVASTVICTSRRKPSEIETLLISLVSTKAVSTIPQAVEFWASVFTVASATEGSAPAMCSLRYRSICRGVLQTMPTPVFAPFASGCCAALSFS